METNFYTPMENDKIRFFARRAIAGRLWLFWQLFIVYALIQAALSWIPELCFGGKVESLNAIISGTANTIPKEISFWPYFAYYGMTLVFSILLVPLGYGIYRNIILYERGVEHDKWKTLFEKYTSAKEFFKALGLSVLKYILVALWSILLIVPGIIKALGWSLTPYIIYDEPELTIWQIMKKSEDMMKGYKGKLFLLGLSFIGWAILGAFTFGILYIWLYPYMQMSYAIFYDDIRRAYYNDDPASHSDGYTPDLEEIPSEHSADADDIH